MKLSIVTTLYHSEDTLVEFYRRAGAAAKMLVDGDYEIIMVNDGSPDGSLELAVELTLNDERLVIVDLSRNFGHHKAMMTGLSHAKGERVFIIDSDLEEDPEYLLTFAERMQNDPCDVVYGVQQKRKGRWFERWSGQLFYSCFKILTGLSLPANIITARLMSRRYVDALLRHEEREVFMAGLWHITGFDQIPQMVQKHSSHKTTYTLGRKMSLLVNSVTSFSNTPLVGIFYFGLSVSMLAVLYFSYLIINRLFLSKPLIGWTSVMASIWLFSGLIISFIGVVGIYLSKIFSETKQRPYTIVRQIYTKQDRETA